MGETTGITWCHSTFNPWRGCQRVSPGCANCYAETMSKRNHALLGQWGPPASGGTRVVASESMWEQPKKWNAAAEKSGKPWRVFCASLADVFEDLPGLKTPRERLFRLIGYTPHLTWLLLTKRPQNVARMVPPWWVDDGSPRPGFAWPHNVWLGTTVEDQKRADERIPHLVQVPVRVRFLSIEPQLEHVNLRPHLLAELEPGRTARLNQIQWVIQGGESGGGARPFDLEWVRYVQADCLKAGVPYFFKQAGAHPHWDGDGTDVDDGPEGRECQHRGAVRLMLNHRAGADPSEWPDNFRVQEFPS